MSEKELRLGFKGKETKHTVDVPDGAPEPWGVDAELAVVGKDHPRIDAILKVTGQAKYSYDMQPEGLAYAKLVGSPHAHARVKRVDLSRAKKLPGVLFTEAREGKTVRFAGEDVAGVVADTEEILDDAIRLIDVEYEVLDHVVTVEAAQKPGAPAVKRGTANVVVGSRGRDGNMKDAQAAHRGADVKLTRVYRTQVQTHCCLETHGSASAWNGKKLTVWASTQGTFSVRRSMAQQLRIPEADVTVITEHMGGGFGSKFSISRWDVFAARAAREIGRPVRAMLDRKADHLVAGNRPNSVQRCIFSANKDGTLLGAEVHSWGTGGVGGGAGVLNPAIYKFKNKARISADVYTHAGRARAFRAPRHPQGVFALEGMIDEIAEAIDMDPLALRKKNDPSDVRQAQYDIGAKKIGWDRRRKKPGSDKGPVKRGLGMASSIWFHTGRIGSIVKCRIARDGSVLVANGAQDIGTGTRTVMAVIAAEELGLRPAQIEVRLGNTTDGLGPTSGGSTTASSIGTATRRSVHAAKRQLLEAVAESIGGDASKMDLKGGKVVGAPKALQFDQACGLLRSGVETNEMADKSDFSYPRFESHVAGCQFAEVEVDTETGRVKVVKIVAVQDCGRVIDPLLARSQINGGVIQGLSYALFEDRRLDPATGDMVNPNFLDYKIAGALEMPEIVPVAFSVANGINHLSMSGLGEPPTVATSGAIGNAVANAIGARVRSLPMTPDKVLEAVRGAS